MILSVLIMSFVMAQNQVEAKSCCPSTAARWAYYLCTNSWPLTPLCISHTGCIESETTCPPGYPYAILENSGNLTILSRGGFIKLYLLQVGSRF